MADGTYLLGGGAGVPDDQYDHHFWTHMRNSGGGTNRNGPWTVGLLLDVPPWLPNPKRDVYSIAMCGAFKVDQKTSGKNPGWGDGEGGGRSKKGGEA